MPCLQVYLLLQGCFARTPKQDGHIILYNCDLCDEKFETKGVKAAATRARTALMDLTKLAKARRQEIQDKKNAM